MTEGRPGRPHRCTTQPAGSARPHADRRALAVNVRQPSGVRSHDASAPTPSYSPHTTPERRAHAHASLVVMNGTTDRFLTQPGRGRAGGHRRHPGHRYSLSVTEAWFTSV